MKKNASDRSTTGNIGEPAAVARAELEAIQWVVRMTSGEATEADRAAFAQWRSRSPAHEAELATAYKLWLGTGPAFAARAIARARTRRSVLALAASVLAIVLGYQALQTWREDAAGGSIALGDGDPLASGHAAVLDLDGSAGHCRLLLGRGEAYFDVMPNPDRPVAGAIEETHVRMLDTAFSIRPYAVGVLVTVTGGHIEVGNGKAAQVLTPGQQMRCNAVRHETAIRSAPATGAGWKRGRSRIAVVLRAAVARGAPACSGSGRYHDARKQDAPAALSRPQPV